MIVEHLLNPPASVSSLQVGCFTFTDKSEELEFSIDEKDVNARIEEVRRSVGPGRHFFYLLGLRRRGILC